jgi:hypothetical protein
MVEECTWSEMVKLKVYLARNVCGERVPGQQQLSRECTWSEMVEEKVYLVIND